MRPGGLFSVAPHNHRQDITLRLLFGDVINWRVSIEETSGVVGLHASPRKTAKLKKDDQTAID